MKRKFKKSSMIKKITVALLAAAMLAGMALPVQAEDSGYSYSSSNSDVDGWSVKSDGENLSFSFGGKTSNPYYMMNECNLSYTGGSSGTFQIIVNAANNSGSVNYNWSYLTNMTVSGDSSGVYTASFSIPVSFFTSDDFTLKFCGTEVSSSEILSGGAEETQAPTEAEAQAETQTETQAETRDESSQAGQSNADVSGKIVIDGSLDDWSGITARDSSDSKISQWKTVKDESGNVYLCFTGNAVSQWDGDYQWKTLTITQNGKSETLQIANLKYKGAEVVTVNEANGNTAAPYYVEILLTPDIITSADFSLTFAGTTVSSDDIQVIDGKEGAPKADAVYDGIVIDGKFSDWDAISKTDVDEENGAGVHNLNSTAMIFDGDYVYIYLSEKQGGSAAGAGTHSNGNYAVTTDLNKTLLFQLTSDGTITGVEGAEAIHVGSQWEISIPASQLPDYLSSIGFGLYLAEPFVDGITNLNGEDSGGPFTGIVYDGLYADWTYYPHTTIQYATAGTQEMVVDANGALYNDGSIIYGHFETTMPEHIEMRGYTLTRNITFKFNNDEDLLFYPRCVAVDENGNINWNPQLSNLEDGTYEFYLMDLGAWGTSQNISDLNSSDRIYGKIMVTVNGGIKDECEFELYSDRVAEKLGLDEGDIKTVSCRFGELGQQWVTITGASSGAIWGVLICVGVVALVLVFRKVRKTGAVKK